MREAVIVASSRTGLAKSFRGSFNMTRPDDLAAHCIKDVLRKTPQLDPAEIDDVILGCGQPHGVQGNNVARVAGTACGSAGFGRGHHRESLLLFRTAGDRDGRASDHDRRRRCGHRRRRRKHHHDRARQRSQSRAEAENARNLHGDGRHGRSRRQAL